MNTTEVARTGLFQVKRLVRDDEPLDRAQKGLTDDLAWHVRGSTADGRSYHVEEIRDQQRVGDSTVLHAVAVVALTEWTAAQVGEYVVPGAIPDAGRRRVDLLRFTGWQEDVETVTFEEFSYRLGDKQGHLWRRVA